MDRVPTIETEYIDAHLRTIDALKARNSWGSVTVPFNDIYTSVNKQSEEAKMEEELMQDFVVKPSFLGNVANLNVRLSSSIEHTANTFNGQKHLRPMVRQWAEG